jgi:hypothetical protein
MTSTTIAKPMPTSSLMVTQLPLQSPSWRDHDLADECDFRIDDVGEEHVAEGPTVKPPLRIPLARTPFDTVVNIEPPESPNWKHSGCLVASTTLRAHVPIYQPPIAQGRNRDRERPIESAPGVDRHPDLSRVTARLALRWPPMWTK